MHILQLDHSAMEEALVTQYTATHWTSKSISTAAAGIAPRRKKCTYYNYTTQPLRKPWSLSTQQLTEQASLFPLQQMAPHQDTSNVHITTRPLSHRGSPGHSVHSNSLNKQVYFHCSKWHRTKRHQMHILQLDHSATEEAMVTQYTATHKTSKTISTAAATGTAPRHIKCTYYN